MKLISLLLGLVSFLFACGEKSSEKSSRNARAATSASTSTSTTNNCPSAGEEIICAATKDDSIIYRSYEQRCQSGFIKVVKAEIPSESEPVPPMVGQQNEL